MLSNDSYLKKYQKLFPGRRQDIETLANQSEPQFNETKWQILAEVLALKPNDICQFPGLEIIDIIFGSLDSNIITLTTKCSEFVTKLENRKNPAPSFIVALCKEFGENPVSPQKYLDLLNSIFTSSDDEIIKHYLIN